STGKNFKIKLPKSQQFDKSIKEDLKKFNPQPPLLTKFQRLLLDKPIIDKLNEDRKIVIELRRWVNKSSGKADIKLYEVIQDPNYITDKNLKQILLEEATVLGVYNHQALYNIYPFADFKTDEVFYENYQD